MYLTDRHSMYSKPVSDLPLVHAVGEKCANLTNIRIGQPRAVPLLTSKNNFQPSVVCMPAVLRRSNQFQVGDAVVVLNAVFVVDLQVRRDGSVHVLPDDSVNYDLLWSSMLVPAHRYA